MTNLTSYKSFNLQEIEEIESRIFGTSSTNDNNLKICPGKTDILNINYESTSGSCGQPKRKVEGDASKWDAVQENIIRILHHGTYDDPMVVHVNKDYLEDDKLDNYEESNVYGLKTNNSDMSWPRCRSYESKSAWANNKIIPDLGSDRASITFIQEFQPEVDTRLTRLRKWFVNTCSCTKSTNS